MHLWLSLPAAIESGLVRILEQDKQVVETDGGYEVRNSRWSSPLRSFQASYGYADADDPVHAAVELMWEDTNAGVDTFNLTDPKSGDIVRVRFDGELQFTNEAGPLYHLDNFTLKEVRDVSPSPTVLPSITGSLTHGSVLTAHDGTWAGSPTTTARQWTANGVDIAGATGTTYTTLAGDVGKQIAFYITQTDAYGGSTRAWAASVGPVV